MTSNLTLHLLLPLQEARGRGRFGQPWSSSPPTPLGWGCRGRAAGTRGWGARVPRLRVKHTRARALSGRLRSASLGSVPGSALPSGRAPSSDFARAGRRVQGAERTRDSSCTTSRWSGSSWSLRSGQERASPARRQRPCCCSPAPSIVRDTPTTARPQLRSERPQPRARRAKAGPRGQGRGARGEEEGASHAPPHLDLANRHAPRILAPPLAFGLRAAQPVIIKLRGGGAPRQRRTAANRARSPCRVIGRATKQKSLLNSGREADGGGGEGSRASGFVGLTCPRSPAATGGGQRVRRRGRRQVRRGVQQRNMAQETNHSQVPMLCSTGCGFYGNPRTNGMCSVCYKEHLQRQNSSNDRISPPDKVLDCPECRITNMKCGTIAATSVSSLSDSLPVQCTDGSVPEALSTLDSTSSSMQPSPVSNQSLLSESVASSQVDSTSADKAIPETEDLQASVSDTAQQPSEEQSKSLEKPKQKKNRCFMCRKKVGLTGFECRCGNVYCGVHRYSDVHNCSYNYKADAAEKIRKENPVVVGEKIQKI